MVVVAVEVGRIVVVGEGLSRGPDVPERHWFNPQPEPFFNGFIYQLPPYTAPERLTICALFLDATPDRLEACASADLLSVVCGDGRQQLRLDPGGVGETEAVCHAAVHYDVPAGGVYHALCW